MGGVAHLIDLRLEKINVQILGDRVVRNSSAWLCLVTALSFACPSTFACSIARCGDPTFNALGNDGVPQSGLRLAVDAERLEKSQGALDDGEFEQLTEERVTLLAAYSVTERFALFARVP